MQLQWRQIDLTLTRLCGYFCNVNMRSLCRKNKLVIFQACACCYWKCALLRVVYCTYQLNNSRPLPAYPSLSLASSSSMKWVFVKTTTYKVGWINSINRSTHNFQHVVREKRDFHHSFRRSVCFALLSAGSCVCSPSAPVESGVRVVDWNK